MFPAPPVGRIILPMADAVTTMTPVADTLYAIPFMQTRVPVFVDAIGTRVTTAGSGTFLNARFGLYRSRGGLPGELLLDSGVVSLAGTGGKFVVLDKPLPWSLKDNPLWGVFIHQGGNTTNAQIVGLNQAMGQATAAMGVADFSALSASAAAYPAGLTASQSFALGLPADGSDVTWVFSTSAQLMPLMGLRRAA